MKLLKQARSTVSPRAANAGAVILLVGLSWSWLFMSRVSELANSEIVGYALALLAFLVIVSLSSYLFIKTIFFFNKRFLSKDKVSFRVIPLLFVLWAGVEYVVALASALVWIGRDGSLDTVVPFASFTPTVSHTPLVYLSRFFGFHGLSAIVIVVIYVCVVKKLRKYAAAVIAVTLVSTLCAWVLYRTPSGPDINSLIVSEKLYERAGNVNADYDLVVFPEYGLDSSDSGKNRFNLEGESEVFYVGSKQVPAMNGHENTLVFGSTQYGDIEERSKSRLIPGGEYLPYVAEVILNGLNVDQTLNYFRHLKAVEKGAPNYETLNIDGEVKLGSSICASIIAPEDYRRFTANGATVLTNSASLGIFDSSLFTFQHQGLAKFMATSNARPFLQSSNDADAFAIDHNGIMVAQASPVSSREVTVTSNSRRTPYTLLGEWPAYVGLIFITVSTIQKRKQKHEN